MAAFSNGTVANITLDEWDTLTVTGVARLQVTVTGRPQFETATTATLTFGPYGAVTTVILNGQGNGTYLQAPSNIPIPMFMVDVSAAQIAAPTAAQLAATNYLYQLNAQPYTIYQSNGTALVAIGAGGGGVTTYAALTDAATATLPTTNTPLANALAAKADKILFPAALASGAVPITHTAHLGSNVNKITATITNGVFAVTATSGAVDGDVGEFDVDATGFFYATGRIKALPGNRLYAGPMETFSCRYSAADDYFYSTTAVAADFGGGDSYIQSMPGGGATGATNVSTFGASGVVSGTAGATTVGLFAGVCAPIREKITAASSAASARIQAVGGAVSTGAPFVAYMPATAASKPTYGRFGMGVTDAVGAGSVNTLGFLSAVNFSQDGSAQRNCAACTNDAADSNYSMVFANASAPTKIALGASFPVNTNNANFPNVFLALFPSIIGAPMAYYCVTDMVTGAVANGICTTTLPVAGQQLLPQVQRTGPSGSSNITIMEYMPITGGGWAQLGAS